MLLSQILRTYDAYELPNALRVITLARLYKTDGVFESIRVTGFAFLVDKSETLRQRVI